MGIKDDLLKKIEAQLRDLADKTNQLNLKSNQLSAKAKAQFDMNMKALEAKRLETQKIVEQIKQSSESALNELMAGFKKSWTELLETFKKAAEQFKPPQP